MKKSVQWTLPGKPCWQPHSAVSSGLRHEAAHHCRGPSGAGASLFLSLPAALGCTPAWAAQVLLKAGSLPKAVVRSSTTQKGPGRLLQLFQLAAFSGLGDESYSLILQIREAVSFFETF